MLRKRGHDVRRQPEAVCTVGLIVVNVLVFFILSLFGQTEDAYFMLQHGAMYEPYVTESHEYYRLITSLFLHFGIQHLLNNMVLLGALGYQLENEIGKIKFLLVYFVVLSLYFGFTSSGVDNSAHVGGLISGIVAAVILYRRKKSDYHEYESYF